MSRSDVLTLPEHIEERSRLARANRVIRGGCVLAAALCVLVAGLFLLPGIHRERRALELVVGENAFDDLPPGIALPTAMLSTFRGLMIHFLWTRGEQLKQDGKYYELQQLSDWICELQPRYPKVWENAAWNMAYNISVGTYSERERWHWVSAGAFLLRDQGIPYNPKTIDLYRELAWIYLHKMGDFMDDHHWAYKRNWAVIMERVLGAPPAEPRDEEVIGAIREIAEAAKAIRQYDIPSKPEALQLYIDADRAKPSMGEFVRRLSELGFAPDAGLLETVARRSRRGLQLSDLVAGGGEEEQRLAALDVLLADDKLAPARDRLLAAVRAHVLSRTLKLDPDFMLELMERFGPFDWRSVYTHGLYWAALGAEECRDVIGLDESQEMNTHRFVQFGIKDTCERGRLIFEPDFEDPFDSFIALLPDYRFADALHELYLQQAEQLRPKNEPPEEYYREGPAGRLFKSGHVNFLHTAVRELYLEGRVQQAQKYYDYLRENYREFDGRTKEMYLTTLEQFVLRDFFEDLESFKQAPVLIHTMLRSSFLNMAYERPLEAGRRMQFAKLGYDKFMEAKRGDRTERRKIPPWPQLKAGAFEDFLLRYPLPRRYNLVYKARAWALVDNRTKLEIYSRVKDALAQACKQNVPELDVAKAFPPPPGVEEFEAARARQGPEAQKPEDVREVEIKEGNKR